MPSQNFVDQLFAECNSIFNIENKKQFIFDVFNKVEDNNIANHVKTFNIIGSVETEFKKDLYEFDHIDLVLMFEMLKWVSTASFYVKKSFVVTYFKWAFENGKTSKALYEQSQDLNTLDLAGDGVFKSMYFKDFSDLTSAIQAIKQNELSKHNIFDINRYAMVECLIYLLWLVRPKNIEDILKIKKSDVNYSNGTITICSKQYDAPAELLEIIKICVDQKFIQIKCGRSSIKTLILGFSDYVLRGSDSPSISFENARLMLSTFSKLSNNLPADNKYFGKVFWLKKIISSSLLAEIYEFEKSTGLIYTPAYKPKPADEYWEFTKKFYDEIDGKILRDYFKWRNFFYGA